MSKLPLPALAIALSPPTDFETELIGDCRILTGLTSRCWSCGRTGSATPPNAGIRWCRRYGLTCAAFLQSIYRLGRVRDSVPRAFKFSPIVPSEQGADVVLETWEDMNHDFQMFGLDSPQSAEALRRIGQVIDVRVRGQKNNMEAVRL